MNKTHKILITGTRGFIGSNTYDFFMRNGLITQTFIGDITNETHWRENLFGDQVIYLIAGKRTETSLDFDINSQSIATLSRAIETTKRKPSKIVLASSQAVYIGNCAPFLETTIPQALTVYAQSKLEGEKYTQILSRKYGIPFVILRYSPVLGPGIRPTSNMSGPLYAWWNAASQGNPIKVFQDGNQTRDYVHVNDVIQANLLALDLPQGIYNVGGGSEVKVKDLAKIVKDTMQSKSEILIVGGDPSSADPKQMLSSIEKIRSYGWRPKSSIESAVYSFVKSQRFEK